MGKASSVDNDPYYTGIIQNVYLELLPAQHIVRADVRPLDLEGNLSLHAVLTNDSHGPQALTAEVKAYAAHVDDRTRTSSWVSEPLGARVSLEGETAQSAQLPARSARVLVYAVRIPSPELWSPATPHLYVLQVTLHQAEATVDTFHTQFGYWSNPDDALVAEQETALEATFRAFASYAQSPRKVVQPKADSSWPPRGGPPTTGTRKAEAACRRWASPTWSAGHTSWLEPPSRSAVRPMLR